MKLIACWIQKWHKLNW